MCCSVQNKYTIRLEYKHKGQTIKNLKIRCLKNEGLWNLWLNSRILTLPLTSYKTRQLCGGGEMECFNHEIIHVFLSFDINNIIMLTYLISVPIFIYIWTNFLLRKGNECIGEKP